MYNENIQVSFLSTHLSTGGGRVKFHTSVLHVQEINLLKDWPPVITQHQNITKSKHCHLCLTIRGVKYWTQKESNNV